MRHSTTIKTILAMCVCLTSARAADEWGSLTGKFVLDGKAPDAEEIVPTKDAAFCGKHKIFNESLVVGKSGGIKNIIVYMYLRPEDDKPPVHPSYEKTAKDKVELANRGCTFSPHVTLLRTTQTILLTNPDAVGHNTKVDCFVNPAINPLIPAGARLEHQFEGAERLPCQVSCGIHPWMTGWVVVKDNPYFAVTDENGEFTISNVPAGNWTFQFWQEKCGYVQNVATESGAEKWKLGRVSKDFSNGVTTNLGAVKLSPADFVK